MALVTYSANAPAGFRVKDVFQPIHGPALPNAAPAATTNGDGNTIIYSGVVVPGTYFVQGLAASNGGGQFLSMNFVPFTPASLDAFHSGGATSAAFLLAGDDVVNGGDNAGYLEGYGGNDTLNGGKGNDVLDGGAGADTMNGGAGNDTYLVDNGVDKVNEAAGGGFDIVNTTVGFALAAGQEVELLQVLDPSFFGDINLGGNDGANVIVGAAGANIISGKGGKDYLFSRDFNPDGTMKAGAGNDLLFGDQGDDGLFAGDGKDQLFGDEGSDGLVGGAGDDVLNGGADADFLFGGAFSPAGQRLANSGNDTLFGDTGNDGLYGFDGDDIIDGGADNDYVEGGAGADTITGGAGSDYLLGQEGADQINGGAGFDYLYGGTGADTFIFKPGDSADWILDFSAVQGDKLRFEGFDFVSVAAIGFVDLSTPGHPAVQMSQYNSTTEAYDQLTIFGVTLAELNATNVLLA